MKRFIETISIKGPDSILLLILALLVLLVLGGKLLLLFSIPAGQDEFNYLSKIYEYENGTLSTSWQSMHVHFFQWLHLVGSSEVDQITAARIIMFVCFIGTAVFLYLLARHFLSIGGSLFSVLCYISLTATIVNGASFRSDTPAIFLIMISIWLFVARHHSELANIASGLALALAALFTLKAGLYLILFAALFLVRLWPLKNAQRRWEGIIPAATFAGALAGGYALLHFLHASRLATFNAVQQGEFIPSTYSSFIDLSRIFPGFEYFQMTLNSNTMIWLLLACGLTIYIIDLYVQKNFLSTQTSYLLVFVLPLLSLLVYRNTFPYFYVFIMPCAMLFCGYAADRLASLFREIHLKVSMILLGFLALAIGFSAILRIAYFQIHTPAFTSRQRELLTVIHKIFPEPVAYLDGCRMVSSFPNAGFFMSTAGMRKYRDSGVPSLKDTIVERSPLFLLVNVPHLDVNSAEPPESAKGYTLRTDDWKALMSHYVHHWGPLWILGKHFAFANGNLWKEFEIVTEGLYTIESEAAVFLDGTLYKNGMVVELSRGKHIVEMGPTRSTVILRWGANLYRPKGEPSWQDLFMGSFM